jgi:hypothetical protein
MPGWGLGRLPGLGLGLDWGSGGDFLREVVTGRDELVEPDKKLRVAVEETSDLFDDFHR